MTARPRNTMSHGQRSQHATTVGLAAHAPGAATPAHSGAAAAHAGTRRAGSTKGAGRELSLLRTHLRKGAPVRDWAPRDIPGAVLAMITEDIAKGLSADQACDIAAGVLGKAAGSPQLPAAGGIIPGAQSSPQQSWQGWYSDMQLAAEYAPQIAAALSSAVSAPLLARRWLAQAQAGAYPAGIGNAAAGASTPPAPRAFLNAAGVTAALAGALAAILGALWGAAWAAGWSAALAALGGNGPQAPGDPADLIRSGQSRMDGILATRLALLEQALLDALRNGESEDALAARIADILGSLPGALLISRSEVTWASSAAALEVYRKAGITWKRWVTRNDAKVCPRCKANQAAGSVPLDAMFPSGTLAPLAHPNCRCSVLPSAGPQAAKDAADLTDPNPVEAEHVLSLMRANFPDKALGWVEDVHWIGPVHVPLSRVDFRDEDSWAASHQPERVADFARQIENGDGYAHPVILVQTPHDQKAVIIDGHHRVLACRKLGWPAKAYLGMADTLTSPMLETHSSQVHQGSSPLNKGTDAPVAAGLAVRAASTGRILMLQRAMTEDDPVAGLWEFPGGRLEDGESALEAARREWAEETGCEPPRSDPDGIWNSADGRYRGFVITVADESAVDAFGPRDEVANPDDPDGDLTEALAWLDPVHLKDNPSIRPELAEDQKRVRRALKGAGRSISQSPELPGPLIE
jgi:SPP1 gp7 family putative phage head morphogenesis protein